MAEDITDSNVAELAGLLGALDEPAAHEPEKEKRDTPESAPETGEDAAPADEEVSSDDEATEPETPAIQAPTSWDAEAKAAFAKLPLDLQQVIADRESSRDRAINKRLQEVADERKAAEAERQAIATHRQQFTSQLAQQAQAMQAQIMGDFGEIDTPQKAYQLSVNDPARYVQFRARIDQLNAVQAQQAQLDQQRQAEDGQRRQAREVEERQKLTEKAPGFIDGPQGEKNLEAAKRYLTELGFSSQDMAEIIDHRWGLVLRDALRGRELSAKAKTAMEKKVVTAPKLVRSGSSSNEKPVDKAALMKIARSGRTDDQVAAFSKHFPELIE